MPPVTRAGSKPGGCTGGCKQARVIRLSSTGCIISPPQPCSSHSGIPLALVQRTYRQASRPPHPYSRPCCAASPMWKAAGAVLLGGGCLIRRSRSLSRSSRAGNRTGSGRSWPQGDGPLPVRNREELTLRRLDASAATICSVIHTTFTSSQPYDVEPTTLPTAFCQQPLMRRGLAHRRDHSRRRQHQREPLVWSVGRRKGRAPTARRQAE
jgi:hypothetical protein